MPDNFRRTSRTTAKPSNKNELQIWYFNSTPGLNVNPSISQRQPHPSQPVDLLLINAPSLLNKISDLRLLVSSSKSIGIIAVAELWLNSSVLTQLSPSHFFAIFRNEREDQRRGGGVDVYVPDSLDCRVRIDLHQGIEDLWLEFPTTSPKKRLSILGCLYRPTS